MPSRSYIFTGAIKNCFLQHVEETIALNPNSPYIVGVAGWHLALYGEWDRGLDLVEKRDETQSVSSQLVPSGAFHGLLSPG